MDAIVNGANSALGHAGGVAAAIVRAGGQIIQDESSDYVSRYGSVKTGSCVPTSGGNLFAKHVIHSVGPIWDDRN